MSWNSLIDAFDGSLNQLHRSAFPGAHSNADRQYAGMSVLESSHHWTVHVDVPGVSESDVDVTVQEGTLVITGERSLPQDEDVRSVFNDRPAGKFRRLLKLGEGADHSAIDAELANGVLTITVQRTAESGPRKINIRTESSASTAETT
jgi:HSP20 family protein